MDPPSYTYIMCGVFRWFSNPKGCCTGLMAPSWMAVPGPLNPPIFGWGRTLNTLASQL